jgi:geranylgeranyl diphosphate synthase type I
MQTTGQRFLEALDTVDCGTAYRQKLLHVLEQLKEANTAEPDIDVLPALTCEGSGGEPRRAAPVVDAWRAMRLAAKLLDDVEDDKVGVQSATTVNLATGLLLAAPLVLWELLELGVPADRVQHMGRMLHRAALQACAGQHADLTAGQSGAGSLDPDSWLDIAQAKSGVPLAWAAWAGASVAGADARTSACYHEYGYHLGVLLQLADDFNGVWSPEDTGDLIAGCLTLPVCYALQVTEGKERNRLEELLRRATLGDDGEAGAQVRQILIDLGAQSYMLVAAGVQRRLALAALQRANCVSTPEQRLAALLDRILPTLRPGIGDQSHL